MSWVEFEGQREHEGIFQVFGLSCSVDADAVYGNRKD